MFYDGYEYLRTPFPRCLYRQRYAYVDVSPPEGKKLFKDRGIDVVYDTPPIRSQDKNLAIYRCAVLLADAEKFETACGALRGKLYTTHPIYHRKIERIVFRKQKEEDYL